MASVNTKVRVERARMNKTYEYMRADLTDMIEVRQMTHRAVADCLGLHIQTVRNAATALGLSRNHSVKNPNFTPGELRLIKAIRGYTVTWNRGW